MFGNRDKAFGLAFEIALAKLKSLFLQDLMGNFGVNTQLDAFKIQHSVNLEI